MPLQQPTSPTAQAPHQQFVVSPTAAGQAGPPSPEWHGATCVSCAPQPSYPPPVHPPYQADAIASQQYGQFMAYQQQPPPQAYASFPAPQSPQHHLPPQQQGPQPLNSPQHMLQVQQQQPMSSPEPTTPHYMTPPTPPPQGFAQLQHQQPTLAPGQQVLSPE